MLPRELDEACDDDWILRRRKSWTSSSGTLTISRPMKPERRRRSSTVAFCEELETAAGDELDTAQQRRTHNAALSSPPPGIQKKVTDFAAKPGCGRAR